MEEKLTISLEQVRMYGHHGVFSQETTVGADFEIWVDAVLPMVAGCLSDDIYGTISYADLYDVVKCEFEIPAKLLEHLVYRISKTLLRHWPQIEHLYVKIRKVSPPIPNFQGSAAVSYTFNKE